MKIYVVIANRWGNREAHSYLVGVYAKKQAALDARASEIGCRGGKYDCDVIEQFVQKKWVHDDTCTWVKSTEAYLPGGGPKLNERERRIADRVGLT